MQFGIMLSDGNATMTEYAAALNTFMMFFGDDRPLASLPDA
jgi:hypothetical protein